MSLFRSIYVVAPDMHKIAHILLFIHVANAEMSFNEECKKIAEKIVILFKQGDLLLKKRLHYDWSLRLLKKIVKRIQEISMELSITQKTGMVIRQMIISRLENDDKKIFEKMVVENFGTLKIGQTEELTKVNEIVSAMKYDKGGLILLGDTLTGKSSSFQKAVKNLKLNSQMDYEIFKVLPNALTNPRSSYDILFLCIKKFEKIPFSTLTYILARVFILLL